MEKFEVDGQLENFVFAEHLRFTFHASFTSLERA